MVPLALIFLSVIVFSGNIQAGSITPPGGSPAATSYTLTDIFNKITRNVAVTAGNHSLSPTTTPGASFHSLADIYNAIPTIYAGDFLSTSTYLGVTGTIPVIAGDGSGDTAVSTTTVSGTKIKLTPPPGFYNGRVTISTTSPDFVAANIKSGARIFGISGSYSGGPVTPTVGSNLPLKTNQKTCYTAAGATVDCAGTGQDGQYQAGAVRSLTDNGDGTISDNSTGLMWEKCTQGLSGTNCETGTATAMNFNLATSTCAAATTGGYTDWRVPNINELGTIADFSVSNPTIDATYFPATVADDYFSSTIGIYYRRAALLDFYTGIVNVEPVTNTNYTRCARIQASPASSAPSQPLKTGAVSCYDSSAREVPCAGTGQDGETQAGADRSYTSNGDGTVTDNTTGLMWQKCPINYSGTFCDDLAVGAVSNGEYNYNNATSSCENSTIGGHSDWRLPNVNEFKTLFDYSKAGLEARVGAIDTSYFPYPTLGAYNTSTSNAGAVYYLSGDYSQGVNAQQTKTSTADTRCVRNAN